MPKLYAYTVTAHTQISSTSISVDSQPGALKAKNKYEALGYELEIAEQVFSKPKYFNHKASVVNIPIDFLEDIDEDNE